MENRIAKIAEAREIIGQVKAYQMVFKWIQMGHDLEDIEDYCLIEARRLLDSVED